MEEAKLSNLQRSKIHYHLRNGSSLPPKEDETPRTTTQRCFTADVRKWDDTRRRSLDLIKSSGAYEIPDLVVGPFREPTHLAKKRLQEKMSGIKGTPRTGRRVKRKQTIDDESTDTDQKIQQR